MSLSENITRSVAAVALVVFAIPAMASAAPKPTLDFVAAPTEKVPTGTVFTKTGTDIVLTSSVLGSFTCAKLNLKGTLNTNDDNIGIIGKGVSEKPVQESCKNPNGAIIVTTVNLTDLRSVTDGVALASFTAIVDVGTRTCEFIGTNVQGTYVNEGQTLTFSNATGITGGVCGSAKLDGSFTLERSSDGKPVKVTF